MPETLTIMIYCLLIILIVVAIIIGIKLIITLQKVNVLLEDVTKKVKTLDRAFEIVNTVNDKIALVGDAVVEFVGGAVKRVFKDRKNKKEEEDEDE